MLGGGFIHLRVNPNWETDNDQGSPVQSSGARSSELELPSKHGATCFWSKDIFKYRSHIGKIDNLVRILCRLTGDRLPSNASSCSRNSSRLSRARSWLLDTKRQTIILPLESVSDWRVEHPPHQQPGILSRLVATQVELSRLAKDDLAHVGVVVRLRDAGVLVVLESVQHDLQVVSWVEEAGKAVFG